MSRVNQFSADEMNTALDAIDPLVDILSAFQTAIASVSYPAIAVKPIAVYREIVPRILTNIMTFHRHLTDNQSRFI